MPSAPSCARRSAATIPTGKRRSPPAAPRSTRSSRAAGRGSFDLVDRRGPHRALTFRPTACTCAPAVAARGANARPVRNKGDSSMSPISPPLRRLASALPYLAAAWLLASPARAHAACAVGFATPRAVAVTGHLTELIFDDACEHVYLTNATSNRVEVFSIADDELKT